jgi:hypothetical protein
MGLDFLKKQNLFGCFQLLRVFIHSFMSQLLLAQKKPETPCGLWLNTHSTAQQQSTRLPSCQNGRQTALPVLPLLSIAIPTFSFFSQLL